MVTSVSSPTFAPEMPQDVSRPGRWGLFLGVIALHAVVAAIVVHSARQPTIVGDPTPISVSLLSESPVSPPADRDGASPVSPLRQSSSRTPIATSPQPVPPQSVVRAPALPQDAVVPVPTSSVPSPVAMSAESPRTLAVDTPASAPAKDASIQSSVVPSGKPVVLAHTSVSYLRKPDLKYPKMSARLGEHGSVTLSVVVDEHGLPVSATVVQSSGYARLDAAARDAVMQVRYVPYTLNGVPQRFEVLAPFTFTPPSE
ncbi:MAG TPA: TonB family protein [Aquabacterium sp.]|nr:TonB family protein [Aquabacterium sp.]